MSKREPCKYWKFSNVSKISARNNEILPHRRRCRVDINLFGLFALIHTYLRRYVIMSPWITPQPSWSSNAVSTRKCR